MGPSEILSLKLHSLGLKKFSPEADCVQIPIYKYGIKLATKGRVSVVDFERAVISIPEVQSAQHVLGLYDYRLKVVSKDLSDFERVLRRRIMNLPGVGNVEANVLLSEERRIGPLAVSYTHLTLPTILLV